MKHKKTNTLGTFIQWVMCGMVIATMTFMTGCGSGSSSTAGNGTGGAGALSGFVNASAEDISVLKAANNLLSMSTTTNSVSQNMSINQMKGMSAAINNGGTIAIDFHHPRLNAYLASLGSTTYEYTSLFTGDGLLYFNDGLAMKYSLSGYQIGNKDGDKWRQFKPAPDEPCRSCYWNWYVREVDGKILTISEDQLNVDGSIGGVAYAVEVLNGEMTTHFLEISKNGYVFSLKEGGQYNGKKEDDKFYVTAFGPFLLTRDAKRYTLVSTFSFPFLIDNTNSVKELVFKLYNGEGQLIGQASCQNTTMRFSFKLYKDGVLTPVESL